MPLPCVFRTNGTGILLPVPNQRMDIEFVVLDQRIYHLNHNCFAVFVRPMNKYCLMFGPVEEPETIMDGMVVAIHYLGNSPWTPGDPRNEENMTTKTVSLDDTNEPLTGYLMDDDKPAITREQLECLFRDKDADR